MRAYRTNVRYDVHEKYSRGRLESSLARSREGGRRLPPGEPQACEHRKDRQHAAIPSEKSLRSWYATPKASRVLPVPPGPVSAMSRVPSSRREVASRAISCSRPTRAVGKGGRLVGCASSVLIGGKSLL